MGFPEVVHSASVEARGAFMAQHNFKRGVDFRTNGLSNLPSRGTLRRSDL